MLDAALEAAVTAGFPQIPSRRPGQAALSPGAGPRAERVLEIGTLGGYSTLAGPRAPAGRPAGDARVRPAPCRRRPRRTSPAPGSPTGGHPRRRRARDARHDRRRGPAPFDLIFIDADKASTPSNSRGRSASRPGSVIIVDNVVRSGELANAETTDESVRGMQQAVELLANHPRLDATVIQTVGAKGYNGFAIAIVT